MLFFQDYRRSGAQDGVQLPPPLGVEVLPRVDNSVIPNTISTLNYPLHTHSAEQHHGNWWGNVPGNSGPWSAPATHATTNGTAFLGVQDGVEVLPCVDNSVIPNTFSTSYQLYSAEQHNWWGNVRGNSEPWSAPATHAPTNGTAFPYSSTISQFQPLSLTSPTPPQQPTQQIGTVAFITTVDGPPSIPPQQPQMEATGKVRRVACTCPNCVNGMNKIKNQDGSTKKKQHVCHFFGCNKVFGKPSLLRTHLRRHMGERPYVCNWLSCGKRFTELDGLWRHRQTHNEKKFVCKECLKRFKRKDHLNKHQKTRTHLKNKEKKSMTIATGTSSFDVLPIAIESIVDELFPFYELQ